MTIQLIWISYISIQTIIPFLFSVVLSQHHLDKTVRENAPIRQLSYTKGHLKRRSDISCKKWSVGDSIVVFFLKILAICRAVAYEYADDYHVESAISRIFNKKYTRTLVKIYWLASQSAQFGQNGLIFVRTQPTGSNSI